MVISRAGRHPLFKGSECHVSVSMIRCCPTIAYTLFRIVRDQISVGDSRPVAVTGQQSVTEQISPHLRHYHRNFFSGFEFELILKAEGIYSTLSFPHYPLKHGAGLFVISCVRVPRQSFNIYRRTSLDVSMSFYTTCYRCLSLMLCHIYGGNFFIDPPTPLEKT